MRNLNILNLFIKTITTILLGILSLQSTAQGIAVWVHDEKYNPIIGSSVSLYHHGILNDKNITGQYGMYNFTPVKPGDYDIVVSYTGYDTITMINAVVDSSQITQYFRLQPSIKGQKNIVKPYKKMFRERIDN